MYIFASIILKPKRAIYGLNFVSSEKVNFSTKIKCALSDWDLMKCRVKVGGMLRKRFIYHKDPMKGHLLESIRFDATHLRLILKTNEFLLNITFQRGLNI